MQEVAQMAARPGQVGLENAKLYLKQAKKSSMETFGSERQSSAVAEKTKNFIEMMDRGLNKEEEYRRH